MLATKPRFACLLQQVKSFGLRSLIAVLVIASLGCLQTDVTRNPRYGVASLVGRHLRLVGDGECHSKFDGSLVVFPYRAPGRPPSPTTLAGYEQSWNRGDRNAGLPAATEFSLQRVVEMGITGPVAVVTVENGPLKGREATLYGAFRGTDGLNLIVDTRGYVLLPSP
jgi:hypothetical protein